MDSTNPGSNVLGVVGGMGPLASAEFVKTIYEYGLNRREQESPSVVLVSDPTFPDRTSAFLAGDYDPLLKQLGNVMRLLLGAGATEIVICCMTIHHLLPKLDPRLRERIISLLDVIFDDLSRTEKRHLLICSSGTRKLRLFERHDKWKQYNDLIVMLDEKDQDAIHHELIYLIKNNIDIQTFFPVLESLLEKYKVDSFIAGCSEIHVLAKNFLQRNNHSNAFHCIDPLNIIAKKWARDTYESRTHTPDIHTYR
jgi:aspartate racemase